MRWKRFWTSWLLGLGLSLAVACSQQAMVTAPPATDLDGSAAVTAISPQPQNSTPVEKASPTPDLPPETAALVASVPAGLVDPPRGDVRMVVISDFNGPYGSTDYDPEVDKAIQLLPFWRPDLVLAGGDMVAGQNPSLTVEQMQAMWAAFDQHVAAPLRQRNLPFGFTIGNHDASGALGVNRQFLFQRERDQASAYWNDPAHDPGVTFVDRFEFPFYYTFQQNDIFFLVWDGSTNRIPADKLAWVEQALASEAAQQAQMRVMIGHLPLYGVSVGRNEPGEVMADGEQLRALLERYNVHTYISGHHHAYYPAHRGNLQLLHAGILGSGPRPLIDSRLPAWKTLTVIDVDFGSPELTRYTTYNMQTLETIEYPQLPRFLAGQNGMVLRRDLDLSDLDASEKAFCEQRLGKALCS